MGISARLNGLLLVVVVLLALGVWLDSTPVPSSPRVSRLSMAQVESLTLTNPRGQVELRQQQGQWQMVAPLPLAANNYQLASMLKLLDAEVSNHFAITAADAARYGLDPPEMELLLNGQERLLVGSSTPLGQRYLWRERDATLLVVAGHYLYPLGVAYTQLLDTRLLPAGTIRGLQLAQQRITLAEGGWQVEPPTDRTSADALAAWIEQWRYARADDIQPLQQRVTTDRVVVEIEGLEGGGRIDFAIAKTADGWIWQWAELGIEYHLPSEVGQSLLTLPASLTQTTAVPAIEEE